MTLTWDFTRYVCWHTYKAVLRSRSHFQGTDSSLIRPAAHTKKISQVSVVTPWGFVRFLPMGFFKWQKAWRHLPAGNAASTFPHSWHTGEGPACTWKLLSAGLRLEYIPLNFRSCREHVSGHCCPDVTTGSLKWKARSWDEGNFKRVRRWILRREWEPQCLSGFMSIHGNQQSDRRQENHNASWKVFKNSRNFAAWGGTNVWHFLMEQHF